MLVNSLPLLMLVNSLPWYSTGSYLAMWMANEGDKSSTRYHYLVNSLPVLMLVDSLPVLMSVNSLPALMLVNSLPVLMVFNWQLSRDVDG